MTELNRKLRREIPVTLDFDRFSRGRHIIIELEPGQSTLPPQIAFRWKGMRRRYRAPIALLMQWTIQETVERQLRERKAKRKGGKRL